MSANLTLTMIKPDAVRKGLIGEILKIIQNNNFIIKALKLTQLTNKDVEHFYSIHKDKTFFKDLLEFMTSGPIVVAVLEKENAVSEFRKLIGNTNPEKAEEGTIRKLFADSLDRNAIHGADSDENAAIEIGFHFSQREIF